MKEKVNDKFDRRKQRMENKYFLGLDMGTGSVGWAVTNNEYTLMKKHGKKDVQDRQTKIRP